MKPGKNLDSEIYRNALEITALGNRAVRAAQRESLERGIANVYSRNGRLYWELPNGDVTFEPPEREDAQGPKSNP